MREGANRGRGNGVSPHNSRVVEAKGRKRRADKVSLTPEGRAGIVMHSAEQPEGGERSQHG